MTSYESGPGYSERPQANYGLAQTAETSGDASLSDFVRFVWREKAWILGGFLALAFMSALLLFAKSSVRPDPVSYSSAIVVTMSGVEGGKYPNGAPYSVTDLRSSAVLEEVYRINELQKYGISLADFGGMISVASYSPAYSVLVDRYRQRLSDKNLTFEERKVIEGEFQQSISSLNSSGLSVTFTAMQSHNLPDQLGTKIVDDIPSAWADVFTKRLGVANLPILVSGSQLVDKALTEQLDYPLGFDYLRQQADVIVNQLKALNAIPGIDTFISTKNSKSLADISREFAAFETFRLDLGLKPLVDLGLSRDVTLTSLIYENRIRSLVRDAAKQSEYSTKVGGVLDSIGSTPTNTGNPSGSAPTTNFSAQIDGAFVDKIVQLSEKGSVLEFEKELQRQRLGFENDTVSISDQRARLTERLAALRQSSLDGVEKQKLEKEFVSGYAGAIVELNTIWDQLVELSSEFSGSRLNYDKTLYRLSSLPNDVRISKPDMIDVRYLQIVGVAAIFGAIAGLVFAYVRSIVGRRRAVR